MINPSSIGDLSLHFPNIQVFFSIGDSVNPCVGHTTFQLHLLSLDNVASASKSRFHKLRWKTCRNEVFSSGYPNECPWYKELSHGQKWSPNSFSECNILMINALKINKSMEHIVYSFIHHQEVFVYQGNSNWYVPWRYLVLPFSFSTVNIGKYDRWYSKLSNLCFY